MLVETFLIFIFNDGGENDGYERGRVSIALFMVDKRVW